jgi:colicin import membrane protein
VWVTAATVTTTDTHRRNDDMKENAMSQGFNTPPGWPPVPEGWSPPAGWQPDPAWPPAPAGWDFRAQPKAPDIEAGSAAPLTGLRAPGVAKRVGFVGLALFALLGLTNGLSGVFSWVGLYVLVTGLWTVVRRRSWLGPMRRSLGAGILAGGLVLTLVGSAIADPADTSSPTAASTSPSPSATPTAEPKPVAVNDLTNADKAAAQSTLDGLELEVAFVGEGSTVVSQDPAPGVKVEPGGTVTLTMRLAVIDAKAAADAAAAQAAADAAAAAAAAEAALGSVAQQNALRSAEGYLDYTAFSHSSLVDQLEFEGYSTGDATWAVDRVSVDWNEQAAKSAKNYLSFTSFSRSGLVDQLEFEGFTPEQAEYGVSQTGL